MNPLRFLVRKLTSWFEVLIERSQNQPHRKICLSKFDQYTDLAEFRIQCFEKMNSLYYNCLRSPNIFQMSLDGIQHVQLVDLGLAPPNTMCNK